MATREESDRLRLKHALEQATSTAHIVEEHHRGVIHENEKQVLDRGKVKSVVPAGRKRNGPNENYMLIQAERKPE